MEQRSRRDLESLVNAQKEQLNRYEKRLKDVVTAYKGLLKEKEALETSLAALTTNNSTQNVATTTALTEDEAAAAAATALNDDNLNTRKLSSVSINSNANNEAVEDKSHLQTQIITLMNSLATLSAEKSRMEASFQTDKKQLRAQLAQKDKQIADLQTNLKDKDAATQAAVNEVKAKWIIERQEREKETNNQMVMIRELQKLYADERHLKESIEMQLNNFKTQFANNETDNTRVRDLQQQLKEAKAQLKQLQHSNKNQQAEQLEDNAAVLKQLQQEMQQLKQHHALALKTEHKRLLQAEEESKKETALHEQRVASLEARLAELSCTVGNYHRLRQEDQQNIQLLKQKLQELQLAHDSDVGVTQQQQQQQKQLQGILQTEQQQHLQNTQDMHAIVDEIMHLKQLLLNENARSKNPIDLSKIFTVGADHTQCQEDVNKLQQQCDAGKAEIAQLHERLEVQKTHISTLQEKVKVLNRNLDEQELELKQHAEKLRQAIKEERSKWKNALTEFENDSRCQINELEQQLQKQRQRSLQLLDEKEQEIKTLHTSFEIFHNANSAAQLSAMKLEHEAYAASSDAESIDVPTTTGKHAVKAKKLSIGDNCHMLHYANEIARKDIEITALRKAKYAAETALRKAIQDKVNAQEELCDKIDCLEEQVDRLERCKTREGANLEYLKNVIISFIVTKDAEGKRHMLNAISTVLQFTAHETQSVNNVFLKK